MDQRARHVEEDVKNILRTRVALTDKIDLLQKQIRYGLEGIKCTAMTAIDEARRTSANFVDSSLAQAQRHRILLGSAVVIAVGLVAGWRQYKRRTRTDSHIVVVPEIYGGANAKKSHDGRTDCRNYTTVREPTI